MELRGQDKRSIGGLMASSSSSVYNNPSIIREPSFSTTSIISSPTTTGGERRRDGTGNNGATTTTTLNPSQTLDHHHHHRQQQQRVREPAVLDPPDPDPIPVSIAVVVGAPSSPPVAGGSTTPRSNSNVIKSTSTVRYRECLKNHAASIGGHVVDGCGEFMPGGEEGTREALKCAACDCHRNFHRKEVDGESQSGPPNCYYCYNPNKADRGSRVPPPTLLPAPLQQQQQHQKFQFGLPPTSPPSGPIHPMMMAFGGGGATESSSEELNVFHSSGARMGQPPPPSFGVSKKRFRTKFSQEQKEKMLEFAEKIGWRIQKQDDPEVQQFCVEVGVKRQVLKVWMHNNKHAMKKKEL